MLNLLFLHRGFYLLNSDRYVFEEIYVTIPGYPYIVLYAYAYVLFLNINSGLYCK